MHLRYFVFLLLAGVVFVLVTAAQLPPTVASHFGLSGAADSHITRDGYLALFLTLAFGVPLAVVGLMTWLPRRYPRLVNIPHRDYWLAPQRRRESAASLARYGAALGSLMILLFCGVHVLILLANAQTPPRLDNTLLVAMLLAFLALLGAWVTLLFRRFPRPRR